MLGLLITVVGLVVDRGSMVDGMVDSVVGNWGMVDNWGVVGYWGMVSNYGGSMNCMVNNWGSVDCMVNSRGSMMGNVSTESCERNSWTTSHQGDKSKTSKDLHDVVVWKDPQRMIPM